MKCGKRYFRKENLLEHESRNCAKANVSDRFTLRLKVCNNEANLVDNKKKISTAILETIDLVLYLPADVLLPNL